MTEIGELQERLSQAVQACNDLARDAAQALLASEESLRDAAKLRGAFEMAAESRNLWKRRALNSGWHPTIGQPARYGEPGEPWNPTGRDGERPSLGEAVGQALGSASMAWEKEAGAGVFDDAWASRVYDGLMAYLADWAHEVAKQANEATAAKIADRLDQLNEAPPRRGSDVEAWIKRFRDSHLGPGEQKTGAWYVANQLLDYYRVHADTGVPLLSDEAMGPHPEDEPDQVDPRYIA